MSDFEFNIRTMARHKLEAICIAQKNAIAKRDHDQFRYLLAMICALEKLGGTIHIEPIELMKLVQGPVKYKVNHKGSPETGITFTLGYDLPGEDEIANIANVQDAILNADGEK